MTLIQAHALLHQASRERDSEGNIIATAGDYGAVRGLVADLVSEGINATVSPELRETVLAVSALGGTGGEGVSLAKIAKHLNLDTSTVSRRCRVAIDKTYLENLEPRKGRPLKLVLGDPLPQEQEILPKPETLAAEGVLHCCAVAGGDKTPPTPQPEPVDVASPQKALSLRSAKSPICAESAQARTPSAEAYIVVGWCDHCRARTRKAAKPSAEHPGWLELTCPRCKTASYTKAEVKHDQSP